MYTVLPRSIAPRFIAKLAYRQNSRLSRFPPLQIPRYTAKLSIRHSFSDTKVVKPIQIPPLVPPTTTF
jgi:hypothetical protein